MSRCLADRSIDHVVLERGEVANSWKTERWDSLRLLTPNWQSRLPGYGYEGDDPDGFRTMPETIDFIEQYAEVISAPVQADTTVTAVSSVDDGWASTSGCPASIGAGTSSGGWMRPACSTSSIPRSTTSIASGECRLFSWRAPTTVAPSISTP